MRVERSMGTSRPESGGQSATDLAPLVDALTALLPDGNPILVDQHV